MFNRQPLSHCFYVYLRILLFIVFKKKLINHKLMLRVVLGRVSTTEFNELQSEQYFNRNHSFCNQALSPFQILVIIKS